MSRIVVTLTDGSRHTLEGAATGDQSLADVLAARGFPLNTRCGRRGLCHGCEVRLTEGSVTCGPLTVTAPALVRACQARAAGPLVLSLPPRSRMEHQPQVGETFRIDVPAAHRPLFAPLPNGLDTGFAIDVGTTTVVVLLVDLASGELLARAGGFNQQLRFGDNVLTRIDAARDPHAARQMQAAVVGETIAPLLARACERAGRSPARLAGGTLAGNTTMLHLLAGEDPTPLGVAPFTPRFLAGRRLAWHDLAGPATAAPPPGPAPPVQLLPSIAGYIGADIVAGIYATGMLFDERPSLLVDIGTNGEVVLQSGGRLTACATAAGPAFEGCGLRCGARARTGAISRLQLGLQPFAVDAGTIGGLPLARADGICGSAYLDFLAAGRRCGLLTATGRFAAAAWAAVPPSHQVTGDGGRALRLAGPDGVGTALVSEVDVAVLLQAKAAIGAGVETLLETAGLTPGEIARVCLAGGFGMHLDVANAAAIGLLPGLDPARVEVVGNTALAGAVLALVDRTTLGEMEQLRTRVEVLELNLQRDFSDRYVEHLLLP